MKRWIIIIVIFSLVVILKLNSDKIKDLIHPLPNDPFSQANWKEPVTKASHQFAVSAGHPLAVKAGLDILRRGGNALDAAITVSYVLGVVQPFASGIGGGGVMLVFPQDRQSPIVYDYEAISPMNGTIPSNYVGVPGLVRAMEQAHKDYGSMELSQLIEPAIQIAEDGYPVDKVLHSVLNSQRSKIVDKEASDIFFPAGNTIKIGNLIKQAKLAETLRVIQKEGSKGFYEGRIADSIEAEVRLSKSDLSNYQVLKKEAVQGKYQDYEIFSAPPPFSGITLIQIMQLSEKLKVNSLKANQNNLITYSQIVNEAYRKRSQDIADPSYMRVNPEELLSESYLNAMLTSITSGHGQSDNFGDEEIEDTTHFVITDKNGMMVSCTNSLSSWCGSGRFVNGFFINNHLTNLNQIPSNVNFWRESKHPRSYISPTIIAKDGKPVLGIGTPGGRKIPILVTQVLYSILNDKENLQQAIDNPKFYIVQNKIYTEGDFLSADTKASLQQQGYQVIIDYSPLNYGAINLLYYDSYSGKIYGGADIRRGGTWELDEEK